jgi:diguanylate cyclase (GGDEF)-like protein
MTLRDVAGDVIRRQEPAQAHHAIWAERAELLRTDRLTGLRNRLGWDEALDEAMFSASRYGAPLIVARIDLDSSSHRAATSSATTDVPRQQPLVSFAGRARKVVRTGDLFARLDGDVLVVALSRCPAPMAANILERIRTSVADQPCSVGWTVWNGQESPQVLMERAEQALSLAQERGGNQVAQV